MLGIVLIMLCYGTITLGFSTESKCFSRFDYDEKLLMKLVKVEHQMEVLNSVKADMKKKIDTEIEELKEKSAKEITKQRNLTAMFIETINLEKVERMKSFETESKELREKSEEELQKQKDITSELLEMKTEQKKLYENEMEDFRQKLSEELKKQQYQTTLLHENLSSEKIKRTKSFEDEMKDFRNKTAEEIYKQRNLSAILQVNDTLLSFLRVPVVVFTVTSPADGPTSDALTFTREIINEGGGFDTATGKFTCPIGGIYYFSLHLVKQYGSGVEQANCYIMKNGVNIVRAYGGSESRSSSSYGVSSSVYLTLATGDVVTVASCYHNTYRYSYTPGAGRTVESSSSFSGFMVRPDLLVPKNTIK